jgi:hypothetical protein
VYGSGGGKYVAKPAVRDYRNEWILGILKPGKVQAVDSALDVQRRRLGEARGNGAS